MFAYVVGLIGIGAGLAAVIANLKAIRADRSSRDSRQPRPLILASALGLVVCLLTFAIAIEASTIEGPILNYGWPFVVATTDRYAGDMRAWIVPSLAFWLLAPQIGVYVHRRFARAAR